MTVTDPFLWHARGTAHRARPPCKCGRNAVSSWICNVAVVIIFGIILLIVGFLIHSPLLWAIGIILVVVGAILALLGAVGRAVFGDDITGDTYPPPVAGPEPRC